MINHDLFSDSLFISAIQTFKDASDNMIDYPEQVINFDVVKEAYCKNFSSTDKASQSADVLVVNNKNKIVFIEFKNGKLNTAQKKSKLKSKLRDSLLIFQDINNKDLNFSRENIEYILVYNLDKNINSISEQVKEMEENKTKGNAPAITEGLNDIQQYLAAKGGEEFVYFGLDLLKNVFVSDVHTYSKEEFEEYYNCNLK